VCQALLGDTRLFQLLARMDEDLAAKAQAEGCACGGRLHRARYPRKPRGSPAELEEGYAWRHSFCCAREGCRRRKTPSSVRFLGRRVYLGVVVLLATACESGLSRRRVAALREQLGVSERTLRRWRTWWRETFPRTRFWRTARAGFVPSVAVGELPISLVERFAGADEIERVARMLAFLGPLSAGAC
jgi:hypothetical protein